MLYRSGRHVIVTHHDADYGRAKGGAFAKLTLRLGERSALIWAHRVIAVSPSLASQLTMLFPSQAYKVTYIPNGAPSLPTCDDDAMAVIERLGLAPKGSLLAVGRPVPEPGF